MRQTARWLATFGALCAAGPLAAQSAPPTGPATPAEAAPATAPAAAPADPQASGNEIVVTGAHTRTPSAKEVYEQAEGISRIGPHEAYVVALPRFWAPVCPGVSGLRAERAGEMVERMRRTIARLKVPLAKGKCSPNLVVAFVDDGRMLLADLQRDRPELFRTLQDSEKAEILTDDAPVHVWNNIAMRWTGGGAPPRDETKASVWGQLNRLAMPESYDIVGALVVFDRDAVLGMTLAQLADYATMRGLSHSKPPAGAQPMPTILSLFEPAGGDPAELTDFDIGYLRSLYYSVPNASAAKKLLDVRRFAAKAAREPPSPAP